MTWNGLDGNRQVQRFFKPSVNAKLVAAAAGIAIGDKAQAPSIASRALRLKALNPKPLNPKHLSPLNPEPFTPSPYTLNPKL